MGPLVPPSLPPAPGTPRHAAAVAAAAASPTAPTAPCASPALRPRAPDAAPALIPRCSCATSRCKGRIPNQRRSYKESLMTPTQSITTLSVSSAASGFEARGTIQRATRSACTSRSYGAIAVSGAHQVAGNAACVCRKFLDFPGLILGVAQNSIFALKLDLLCHSRNDWQSSTRFQKISRLSGADLRGRSELNLRAET
jgi:hypothetical protein